MPQSAAAPQSFRQHRLFDIVYSAASTCSCFSLTPNSTFFLAPAPRPAHAHKITSKRSLGEDPTPQSHQAPQANASSAAGSSPQKARLNPSADSSGGGDAVALLAEGGRGRDAPSVVHAAGRPPLPHGGGGNGPTVYSNKHLHRGGEPAPACGDWAGGGGGDDAGGGGDDASLAGLSLASGDSMQYSVDSG